MLGKELDQPLPASQLKFIWAGKELDGGKTLEENGYSLSRDHSSVIILKIDINRLEKTIKNREDTIRHNLMKDVDELIRTEGWTMEGLETWRREELSNLDNWRKALCEAKKNEEEERRRLQIEEDEAFARSLAGM